MKQANFPSKIWKVPEELDQYVIVLSIFTTLFFCREEMNQLNLGCFVLFPRKRG